MLRRDSKDVNAKRQIFGGWVGQLEMHASALIDTDRVVLTGVSMGGAGTWSLAAADPKHWSAIVPISHGADTASAAKLVGLPCWCFHGAADRIVSPQSAKKAVW